MYTVVDKPLDKISFKNFHGGKSAKQYADEYVSDNIMTFDIETTSYFIGMNTIIPFNYFDTDMAKKLRDGTLKRQACLYHWQFSVEDINDGSCNKFTGRTWDDFRIFLEHLDAYCIALKFVYIHNYAFEFAWLLNVIGFDGNDDSVFAREPHRPMKSYTSEFNIEFRCSYFLTQKSLDKWGKELGFPKSHDLDYNKIRTPLTPLTPEELFYCYRDIEIIHKGIQKYRNKYQHVYNIPLTLTGEVRRMLATALKGDKKECKEFTKKCQKLLPAEYEEYFMLMWAFLGGLVRRNPAYSDITIRTRFLFKDINSSYPWVLISEMFPMKPFTETKDLKKMNDPKVTYIVEFRAKHVYSKIPFLFMSSSKIEDGENVKTMNGAIATADSFRTVLTKPDFEIFKKCYNADIEILTLKTSKLEYLPDVYRRFIIKCYKDKTELKGIDEELYVVSKKVINSLFGINCQKLLCDSVVFDIFHQNNKGEDEVWYKQKLTKDNFDEKLYDATHTQSGNLKHFNIAAQIGVFCTAYARANLMKAVLFKPDDVMYTDTDSVKAIWSQEYEDFITQYNDDVYKKHALIASQLGIDVLDLSPEGLDEKNPGNKIRYPIGILDDDGSDEVTAFRTLGAKKYCYEKKNGKLKITVAGVPKDGSCCLKTIEDFADGMKFTARVMHENKVKEKMIPYYLTDMKPVTFPDGYTATEKYGICLVPTDYKLSSSNDMYTDTDEFYNTLWQATRNPNIFK